MLKCVRYVVKRRGENVLSATKTFVHQSAGTGTKAAFWLSTTFHSLALD